MLSRLLINNVRAAGTWIGTPIGLVGLWLLSEWFFSTEGGVMVGLIGGSLALLGLGVGVAAAFYVFRD